MWDTIMLLIGVALAGVWLFVVIYWWSEGAIETSEALLLAAVFGGLVFGMFAAQNAWQFVLAFVPLAGAAGYAIYSYRVGGIRAYYRSRIQEYIEAIQFDPRNRGARQRLAETLYTLGELDKAIDEMQVAVDMGGDIECVHTLAGWTRERHLRDTPNPVCRWCETENARGARACEKCGADLPFDSALTRWLMGGRTSSARYYLIVVTGLAMLCVSLLVMPVVYAFIPLAACVLAIAGWSLVSSAKS